MSQAVDNRGSLISVALALRVEPTDLVAHAPPRDNKRSGCGVKWVHP